MPLCRPSRDMATNRLRGPQNSTVELHTVVERTLVVAVLTLSGVATGAIAARLLGEISWLGAKLYITIGGMAGAAPAALRLRSSKVDQ